MLTMQGSILATILVHLLAITVSQSQALKLEKLSLNMTHTLFPNISTHLKDIKIPLTINSENLLTVQVSLGSPPVGVHLLMDTGSSLTWAQCQPCKACYPQKSPIYDSRKSRTFQKLPCTNPICRNVPFKCVKNECAYTVTYAGGTVIKGGAASEMFYFPTATSAGAPFPNVAFGCSNEVYKAQTLARGGLISGIMGLNRAPHSLLTQLFPPQKRRFSYCLSPFLNGKPSVNTVLRFGDDVPTRAPTLQTPFRTGFSNYHLDLQDISVATRRLRIPAGTFAPKPRGGGGMIIDSGCLITQIEKKGWGGKPYSTVMDAFKKYYAALRLQKIKGPAGSDVCYRKPAGFGQLASMTYHFRGADYVVDGKYAHFVDERGGFFCVAVMPGKGASVLGNWHQQNMRLVYDASAGVLRFGVEDCAKDRP